MCLATGSWAGSAHAAFDPNNIISDSVFTNKNTMSVSAIQNFLNSKVPVCDTWHAAGSGSQGEQPPWTCLKDYNENGRSAAQIIYDTSQYYGVNPQVILVTLQKENGLITDTWPYRWQYRTAMGMGCPDGAPCDAQYYGFANQVDQGTRHLKNFFDQNPNWFIPHRAGINNVKFNPNAACGTSTLNINKGTSALYSYTPYQPNAAALANMYGLGDGCSSYGNRNFWRDFTNWFGSTTTPQLSVILKNGDNRLYLNEGGRGKRWIPSPDVLSAWGLDTYPVQAVDDSYFNSLPERAAISRITSTSYTTYYMDGGKRHWIANRDVGLIWGHDVNSAVGVENWTAETIPEGDPLGRFVRSTDTSDTRVWLMNGSTKNYIPNADILRKWGYNNNITSMSPGYINGKTEGALAGPKISVGGDDYFVTRGIAFKISGNMKNVWNLTSKVETVPQVIAFMPNLTGIQFVTEAGSSQVYLLNGGTKHLLSSPDMVRAWGGWNIPYTALESDDMSGFATGAAADKVVIQNTSGQKFTIDGRRHAVPDQQTLDAWTASGQSIPTYINDLVNILPSGPDTGIINQVIGNHLIFAMDRGQKVYFPSFTALYAWGYGRTSGISYIDISLGNQLPTKGVVGNVVSDGTNTYLLNAGKKYLSPSAAIANQWLLNNPFTVDAATTSRIPSGGTLTTTAKINNRYFLVDGDVGFDLDSSGDAYGASGSSVVLDDQYLGSLGQATYFAKSLDVSDGRIWFINKGTKTYIDTMDKLYTLGFAGSGPPITILKPATLNSIPTNNSAFNPLLIKKASSSPVVLNGTGYYAFGDLTIMQNWVGASTPLEVSDSIFNRFSVNGLAPNVANGSDPKIYTFENGTKRWIANPVTYQSSYAQYGLRRIPDFTLNLVPTGSNIN
ncbi:hypothetical protein EPO04_03355 [Patescibacteria group bacterium]|nr:MAG: hypothetical protein EPO04_03355 [Patescibacteria group bacterium]